MSELKRFRGNLHGRPFLASIDTEGKRKDRNNCALVVRDYQVPIGYQAYILDASIPEAFAHNLSSYCPNASILTNIAGTDHLCSGDIVEVSENGQILLPYRSSSDDNVLFITNHCNSNCIMCPDADPNRKLDLGDRKDYLLRLIDLIPPDCKHITITGGEPTLLKWDLLLILSACREKLPETDFLMLSNGRTLCIREYRESFLHSVPNRFRLAVPLYGTTPEEHDTITRSPGGFLQTLSALKRLQSRMEIELRVVIMKQNYHRLPTIAAFISETLPAVKTVSFMGMELLGNAALRREYLWVDFAETVSDLEKAVMTLLSSGIDTRIYNYPLCSLPRNLWSIAAKSISDYKVRYPEACTSCRVQSLCGGFFFSTLHLADISVHPVQREYRI